MSNPFAKHLINSCKKFPRRLLPNLANDLFNTYDYARIYHKIEVDQSSIASRHNTDQNLGIFSPGSIPKNSIIFRVSTEKAITGLEILDSDFNKARTLEHRIDKVNNELTQRGEYNR